MHIGVFVCFHESQGASYFKGLGSSLSKMLNSEDPSLFHMMYTTLEI